MPIPSYPENRREEYLNNIATGSGEIPPYPENREEQYLDAIARNGGGGGGGGGGASGGGVLVAHDVDGTLDKTWQEISDSISDGVPAFIITDSTDLLKPQCMPVMYVAHVDSLYQVIGMYFEVENDWVVSGLGYAAESADGYPVNL